MTTSATKYELTRGQIEQFLYEEARLADEHDYDGWERLWTDDAMYWVPANGDGVDPTGEMSIVYDNRRRIATRMAQLKSGKRYAQTPPSRTRRLVSNIEVMPTAARPLGVHAPESDLEVQANVMIMESRASGLNPIMCRVTYHLRPGTTELTMSYKKVVLINNDRPLPTLSFVL